MHQFSQYLGSEHFKKWVQGKRSINVEHFSNFLNMGQLSQTKAVVFSLDGSPPTLPKVMLTKMAKEPTFISKVPRVLQRREICGYVKVGGPPSHTLGSTEQWRGARHRAAGAAVAPCAHGQWRCAPVWTRCRAAQRWRAARARPAPAHTEPPPAGAQRTEERPVTVWPRPYTHACRHRPLPAHPAVTQTTPTAYLHVIEMEVFLNDGPGFLLQLLFRERSLRRTHRGQGGFSLHWA